MAERKLNLRVISPRTATDKRPYKLQKESEMVILRCKTGDLGILVGRMPCTMVLGSGILRSFDEGKEYFMAIMGGVAHVQNDVVTVLTDTALFPQEIDQDEVKSQISEMEEKIKDTADLALKDSLRADLRGLRVQLEVAGK